MEPQTCLRCGTPMRHLTTEYLQLGKASFFVGTWSNLLAGGLHVAIQGCPKCGKLEFFAADEDLTSFQERSGLPQKACPKCGNTHDFDYPRCPACGYEY